MDRKTVLSLPLIFWSRTGADLQHSISTMAVHGTCLATGSLTGDIVMWVVKDLVCTPLILATPRLGMECRQLAFVKPPYQTALGVSLWVASLHDDNRIRVWDWEDGRCVSVSEPSLLQPIPRVTLMRPIQNRLLAIGGEGCVLHIVDSWSLTKISSYRLPAHLIDISAQNCGLGTRLVALCGEDQVILWELSDVSNYLIDIEVPRPTDPRPALKLTMGTSESPHKVAFSTDCTLLAVAYESIISFVHEDWVRNNVVYYCQQG